MPLTILVVDDDEHLCKCWQVTLERAFPEAEIIPCYNGKDANTKYEEARPDLIVLDVMLPERNGWETCRKIRHYESTEKIHPPAIILMVTGIGPNLNEMTAPLHGADDYMDKPLRKEDLVRRIKTLLAKNPD